MPEMIPTHWDSAGNVNGYTGRVAIIGLDALPLLLLAMLRYLPGMDPRGQAYMRMGSFYNGFVVLFTLFMVGMTWTSELTVFGILPWDSAGNVNGYTGRVAIIGLDALPLLLLAMLRYLPGMDPRGQAYMRMGSFYNGFVVLFTLFMVGMTWTSELTVFGILPENDSPIGTITTLVVGMGFILLGNYMP